MSEFDGRTLWVDCLECGHQQAYMGRNVACEECGGEMEEPTEQELKAVEG